MLHRDERGGLDSEERWSLVPPRRNGSRCSARRPIQTMQALLERRFGNTHVSDLVTDPRDPPTYAESTDLLTKLTAFVQLYRLPHPLFVSQVYQARWNELAERMEQSLASLSAEHAAHPSGMLIGRAERLYRHVYGKDLSSRPLTMVRESIDKCDLISS